MDYSGNAVCTCGKEMSGGGGQFGGILNTSWRTCECGITAVFYTARDGYDVSLNATPENDAKNKAETKDKLLSIFKLANIEILDHWDIKNEYYGNAADWLLVKTKSGLIKIGWRKRVINIDWKDTGIKHTIDDNVTKNEYGCHAWEYSKAVEYLSQLKI
jgi:hypothetical protein